MIYFKMNRFKKFILISKCKKPFIIKSNGNGSGNVYLYLAFLILFVYIEKNMYYVHNF